MVEQDGVARRAANADDCRGARQGELLHRGGWRLIERGAAAGVEDERDERAVEVADTKEVAMDEVFLRDRAALVIDAVDAVLIDDLEASALLHHLGVLARDDPGVNDNIIAWVAANGSDRLV